MRRVADRREMIFIISPPPNQQWMNCRIVVLKKTNFHIYPSSLKSKEKRPRKKKKKTENKTSSFWWRTQLPRPISKRKEKHLNVTVCRPRKSRSHPKERIKFIKKGFGAFNTPTTQPYKKKRRRRKKSVVIIITFYSSILLIILQLRKDVPLTTKKKKNRRRINPPTTSVVLYYPVSRSEMQRYPHAAHNIQQFLKGRRGKKNSSQRKEKKKLASFIVLVLARYHI